MMTRSLQAELRQRPTSHPIQTTRTTPAVTAAADAERGQVADAITARIAATKSRLLAGGLLQEIEWGTVVPVVLPDLPDPRGRKTYKYSTLDALIEQRPALDHGTLSTERSDNTVLVILDPLSITDAHLFRWGDPPHIYRVKAVDGIVQDEASGVRYFSEVTVIR